MPTPPTFPLTVFYDGACSVCAAEMAVYRRKNHGGRLVFVDISDPAFDPSPWGITLEAFMAQMHAIDRDGRAYRGVEGFWAIWQAFPASTFYGLLGTLLMLPGFNLLARLGYRGFARIRRYLPKRASRCDGGTCRMDRH